MSWHVDRSEGGAKIKDEGGNTVLWTHNTHLRGRRTDDEVMEIATLASAAPELLAALKDAMRSTRKDFKSGADGDRQHKEAWAEQFAAIAKAEGGQP